MEQQDPGRAVGELRSIWQTLGIDPTVLVPDSEGTIAPATTLPVVEGQLPVAIEALPRLTLQGESAAPELRLGTTIGHGGMGVVRLATQLPLGREVAVKTGRPDCALELLREARSTGLLEHPNVVPVHALGRDAENAPMLIMKRVDGVSWRALIADPRHPLRAGDARDPLEYHLGILLQVCNAVSFAHSKGILHRDIKPENVMVGRFGEVYLLDWGMAAAVSERAAEILPRASEIQTVAGTPPYMAPEMAAADGARIDERSDVYLLGAVLHECITGQPRHLGASLLEVLGAAYRSPPFAYGPEVPEELAAICNRATAAEPAARFASAEELRRALERFLSHRASSALAQMARGRLAELAELLRRRDAEAERQIHVRFGECRLAFQEALKTWPENGEAQRGLAQAVELMVAHLIAHTDFGAATALLRELPDPPPELKRRLVELEASLAEERARLERLLALEQDLDLNVGRRTRATLVLVVGVLYTALPLIGGLAERRGWLSPRPRSLVLQSLLFGLIWLVGASWSRKTLFRSAVNRRLAFSVGTITVTATAFTGAAAWLGLSTSLTLLMLMPVFFLSLAILAAFVDKRLILSALTYLLGFAVAAAVRPWTYEVFAASTAVALVYVAYLWRPERFCSGETL